MHDDLEIQAQAYGYFLAEAPELLQTIEQEILTLPNDHTTAKVHSLMRALHTLKGAAANVGLRTIERIAHDFEDVTRVFYNLELEIDLPIQSLLLDGYESLQECLEAQMMDKEIDESGVLDRLAATISQLKSILGDWTEAEIALPTAMELGFDIVASIFETTIQEQINGLSAVIATDNSAEIIAYLQVCTEICIGLAESCELPGFLEINQRIVAAISLNPTQIDSIASLALANLRTAQAQVLGGDRLIGGTVNPDLLKFSQAKLSEDLSLDESTSEALELNDNWSIALHSAESLELNDDWSIEPTISEVSGLTDNVSIELPIVKFDESHQILPIASGEAELPAFRAFLTSDNFRTRNGISHETQQLFERMIQLCWDWFRHEIQTPHSQLTLELLVTSDGLADLDYVHHWIRLLLQRVSTPSDRTSLHLYRESCIYQVVYAVAKHLAATNSLHQITPEFLSELRSSLQKTVINYKQEPPVTINESGWLDRIVLPHHWSPLNTNKVTRDSLITEVWGQAKSLDSSAKFNTEITAEFTHDCQQQLTTIDRLQAILIESHHRSIQHQQLLRSLLSRHQTSETAELIAGSSQLAADLAIALETASALYQVSDRQQQLLGKISAISLPGSIG